MVIWKRTGQPGNKEKSNSQGGYLEVLMRGMMLGDKTCPYSLPRGCIEPIEAGDLASTIYDFGFTILDVR
jgi:hypothetical protein